MFALKKHFWALCLFPCLAAGAEKLPVTFDGYVTNITSPTEFDIGQRHIVGDSHTVLTRLYQGRGTGTLLNTRFLRIGMLVHINGEFQKGHSPFVAKEVRTSLDSSAENAPGQKLSGTAILQDPPKLKNTDHGIEGTLWVDGYLLQITAQTKLSFSDGSSFSTDKIGPNFWATYEGARSTDYSLVASQISFSKNQVDEEEKDFRKKGEPEIDEPDYVKRTPGQIKFKSCPALSILPDKEIQDYIRKLGQSLVPKYQKDLPLSDPTKIDFRFYVIKHPSWWKGVDKDGISSNGVYWITDKRLSSLQNEAQLAALLSQSIASTLQKQSYEHRTRLKTHGYIGIAGDAAFILFTPAFPIQVGNFLSYEALILQLDKHAARIGLTYMLNAGYDIREAPFTWEIAAGRKPSNPLKRDTPAPSITQILMQEISMDYAAINYGELKTNQEFYQQELKHLASVSLELEKDKQRQQ